jgi:hypothetical protein
MPGRTVCLLTIFAAAMALLESAVVVYMRRLYYPDNPLEIFPLRFLGAYDAVVELSREMATIMMLVTVALLAERSSRTRSFAAFVFTFGVWDLFYYAWLKALIDWPRTWWEWDVLFLIPIVWLGPWICPAMISLIFIVWGAWTLLSTENIAFSIRSWLLFSLGAILGLTTFFQPAIAALAVGGSEALRHYTPGTFWWWLFAPSVALMACGLAMTLRPGKQGTIV